MSKKDVEAAVAVVPGEHDRRRIPSCEAFGEKPSETPASTDPNANTGTLNRQLKSRHVSMIALGGVIGTGLFIGTATNLQNAGPAGLLISYCFMASLLFAVMVALGEMIAAIPIPGAQLALASRFFSPEMGFAIGWLYWYCYVIYYLCAMCWSTEYAACAVCNPRHNYLRVHNHQSLTPVLLPAELSAAAVIITYWTNPGPDCTTGICSNAPWVAIMLFVVILANAFGTRIFGEIEFWAASIKVITIVGLIIVSIVITAGGGPNHEAIGFRYWNQTGGFVQYQGIEGAWGRFLGFFSVLISAAFAFIGTEMTAIAAAEVDDPARTVPRAIKTVWVRLALFYITSALLIGMLVSPTNPDLNLGSTAAKSPFVIAIKEAGITALPSIINAALLTSAWSAGIADLYINSRTLYGLYTRGATPRFADKWLGRTRKSDGLPWVCVLVCALFTPLAFFAASPSKSAGQAFGYFANMCSVCGMLSWGCILGTAIRWNRGLKIHGIDRSLLPYKAPLQPYLSWYGLVVAFVVITFSGFTAFIHKFNTSAFITTYFPIPFFVVLFVGYKVINKSKMVPYEDMDFVTGASRDFTRSSSPSFDDEKARTTRSKGVRGWFGRRTV